MSSAEKMGKKMALLMIMVLLVSTALAKSNRDSFRKAMVASDSLQCSQAGRDILLKKGSAVDAAIATLLCLGVVIPESMGIGGGFLMTIYNRKNEKIEVLDAREVAPLAANSTMYGNDSNASVYGGLAVAVPGSIKGMEAAHRKYGNLKWKELFKAAINIGNNGFVVGEHMAMSINKTEDKIRKFSTLRNLLWNKDEHRFYREGDVMKNPKLAEALSEIARDGAKTFYSGDIAKRLASDIQNANGLITEEDLKKYQVRWRVPVKARMPGSMTLNTFPIPGSGAILTFILNIMKGFKPKPRMSRDEKILYYHRVIETFKFAYARRTELEDSNSPVVRQMSNLLTSEVYADAIRKKIVDNRTFSDPQHYEMLNEIFWPVFNDHGTSHLSVLAENGDAVAVTSTVNLFFGSHLISPSTGILLNDEMNDFSIPNIVSDFGIRPSRANQIYPGRRPLSSMSPSIFIDDDANVRLIVGAAGGTKITTSVALVSMSHLWLEHDITTAIREPRLHNQFDPLITDTENTFPQAIKQGLEAIGHKLKNLEKMGSSVVGIARGKNGFLYGSADPRKGGGVAGY